MKELVWEDPPEKSRKVRDTQTRRLIAQLQEHPGKWARLDEFGAQPTNPRRANHLRQSGIETACRQGVIYARWPEDAS